MSGPDEVNLAQTLQRAFVEAGEPSVTSVAAGSGTSRQRLSDWRSGKHVPSRFEDVEPVLAYFRIIAVSGSDGPIAADGDRVTGRADEWWRQAWQRSTVAAAASRALPQAVPSTETVDRRPLAIAVVGLLVLLVVALAIAAFMASWAYR